jgi:hypothetical protein
MCVWAVDLLKFLFFLLLMHRQFQNMYICMLKSISCQQCMLAVASCTPQAFSHDYFPCMSSLARLALTTRLSVASHEAWW